MTRLSQERQAGDEVEITPEMVEAGLAVLQNYDERFESQTETVKRIFFAMKNA